MSPKKYNRDRRHFLKSITAAGAFSLISATGARQSPATPQQNQQRKNSKYPQVPRRTLGKTGVNVPILSHGLMYNVVDNQTILKRGLMWGVNYWDTANMYGNGNSELGIGKFLRTQPGARKDLFIVSKASYATTAQEMEERLQTSLKRMNIASIDLYYGIHGLSDPDDLSEEIRQWATDAKKRGLIRYFGFSTHKNMTECLNKAAELNWIDAVMTSYNFRLMDDKKLNAAIDRCHRANVGLIAMKVQGKSVWGMTDTKLYTHFLNSGYTEGQAKLKAVLEDKRFASACLTMQSTALLVSNVAAALDKVKLSGQDRSRLNDFAIAESDNYCMGCGSICDQAVEGAPVSDIIRYLMYHNSYSDPEKARELFLQIPSKLRNRLASTDFSSIERKCPQKLPIGQLVQYAVESLC